jgi:hypothetical protein
MVEQQQEHALEPAELLSRLCEGGMALATASVAGTEFDEHRARAYERGTALAEAALHVAAGLVAQQQSQAIEALGELAGIAGTLTQRLGRLEGEQQEGNDGDS